MTEIQIDEQGRPMPPEHAGEAETLLGFLDFQRRTLEWKCRGLDEAQLRAPLAPTSMTLAGLIKHLALVEDFWFTEVVGGQPLPEPWASVDLEADPDWEWKSAARDGAAQLFSLWNESLERSRANVAAELERGEAEALAASHSAWGGKGSVSLRWVLTHMIEEYARHNGHADLLREALDGETGE